MLDKLKKQVYLANMELVKKKLIIETFGNVSGIDREKQIVAIKPSGVDYDTLRPDDVVLVDLNSGEVIEGDMRPSSDTKTHLVLYKSFSEIQGVVHTHSAYATSWAQAQRPIPCLGTTHADYSPAEIPCTGVMEDDAIEGDYEKETGYQIISTFRQKKYDYQYTPMVLVASHGPFTWGESPAKAVYHSNVLEYLAKMAYRTLRINNNVGSLKKNLIDKHFYRKHGENAYYGQE